MNVGRVTGAAGRTWLVGVVVAAAGLGVGVSGAQAQYGSSQTFRSGYAPGGVAVDHSGDVAYSIPGGGGQVLDQVLVIKPDGYNDAYYAYDPEGLALDDGGQIFIASTDPSQVLEQTAAARPQTIGSGFSHPQGVAVDGQGDVFVADTGNSRVVEVYSGGLQTTIGSGFSHPQGVAVDAQGDVFVADTGDDQVVEVHPDGTQQTIGSFSDPESVAVDNQGDVFVGTGSEVVEVFPNGAQQVLESGVDAVGVALDSGGDLYVADDENDDIGELPFSPDATSTTLSCGPAAAVGASQRCAVSVSDTSLDALTPTGTVTFSASGQGSFGDNTASCTLVDGACYLDYTPTATGSGTQSVTASYEGAYQYASSSQSAPLTIKALTPTVTTTCARPASTQLHQVATGRAVAIGCTATVRAPAGVKGVAVPTGTVTFNASPGGDQGEEIEPGSCTLKRSGTTARCATKFVTATADDYTITGAYGGDGNYITASGQAVLDLN